MKTVLFCLLTLCLVHLANCQNIVKSRSGPNTYKNAITTTGGGYPIIWDGVYYIGTMQYERVLFSNSKSIMLGMSIGGGIGNRFNIPVILKVYTLIGRKYNKLEISAGIAGSNSKDRFSTLSCENCILPAGVIGYRYQNSQKPFVFKIGVGYPELIYIGLGFQF